jgi:hypothetical protein
LAQVSPILQPVPFRALLAFVEKKLRQNCAKGAAFWLFGLFERC